MSSPIDLTPAQRRSALRLIDIHLPHTDVWAYGSRVKWTSRPSSDLDLVAFAGPEQRRQVADLREAFEESNLPFRVDLLIWDDIPESFREEIDAEHVALVECTPDSQQWCTLGDVAHITMGQSPPGATVNGETGMPLLNGPTEFGPHHPEPCQYTLDPRKVARAGDILFCVRGSTTGRMNWADRQYAIGPGIAAIRHRNGQHLQPFVRAIIESRLPTLLAGATDSVFRNVSRSELTGLPIPDLPLKRQSDIAHILGTLDDRIELNRQMCDTLEAMVRTLFKSWFVDFDPVHRPSTASHLSTRVAELFPRQLVESPIGGVPRGWDSGPLGDLVAFNPPRRLARGTMSPYLPMSNMPTDGHRPDAMLERRFRSGTKFVNGDTLLARITPCLENGKAAYVDFLDADTVGWGSTEYIVMRPRTPFPSVFAYCLARTHRFRRFAIQNMVGTSGRQRVSWQALSRFPVAIPPAEVAVLFDGIAGSLLRAAKRNAQESSRLRLIRDRVLPHLLQFGSRDSTRPQHDRERREESR